MAKDVIKVVELRTKTPDQLQESLLSAKRELLNFRFQRVTGETTNTSRVRQLRKHIARIKTVLVEMAAKKAAA